MLLDLLYHHRQGKPRSRFLRRDDVLLVFVDEEEKQAFIDAEEQAKTAINRAARRKVIATHPKPVTVDLKAVDQELVLVNDYQQIIEDYFSQLEEDDIEALLFV